MSLKGKNIKKLYEDIIGQENLAYKMGWNDCKELYRYNNGVYIRMINENYDVNNLTFRDFIEVCDTLEFPVFEVETICNPFSEPHRRVTPKMYKNMSQFRETMPAWYARHYDYKNDRADYFLHYKGIEDGSFDVTAENNHSIYLWHFEIVQRCVVVLSEIRFTD